MTLSLRSAVLLAIPALLLIPVGAPAQEPLERQVILIRTAEVGDEDRAIKELEDVIRSLKDSDKETREQLERALKLLKDKSKNKETDAKARAAEIEKAQAEAKQAAEELKKVQEQMQAAAQRFAKAQQTLAELQGRDKFRFDLKVYPMASPVPVPPTPPLPSAGERTRDLEKKLDDLTRQIEELRKELRKAPQP